MDKVALKIPGLGKIAKDENLQARPCQVARAGGQQKGRGGYMTSRGNNMWIFFEKLLGVPFGDVMGWGCNARGLAQQLKPVTFTRPDRRLPPPRSSDGGR